MPVPVPAPVVAPFARLAKAAANWVGEVAAVDVYVKPAMVYVSPAANPRVAVMVAVSVTAGVGATGATAITVSLPTPFCAKLVVT